MCGRAGRSGGQARAHLILNTDETKIEDAALKALVTNKENCMRTTLISAVGGSVQSVSCPRCCAVCNPAAFADGDIVAPGKAPPRKKRRVAVRKVDKATTDSLKIRLEATRAKFVVDNPYLCIVGCQLVCPDSTIESICSSAKFISVRSDMDCFGLRNELKDKFLNVVLEVVNS